MVRKFAEEEVRELSLEEAEEERPEELKTIGERRGKS